MIVREIYPQVQCLSTKESIKLSTYVRINRNGQNWLVFLSDNISIDDQTSHNYIHGFYMSFIDRVCLTKYMYIVDEESSYFQEQLKQETLVKDSNHLTDKEKFLFEKRLV